MAILIYLFFFNFIVPSCELNGLENNEVDGASDDNNFIIFYDNVDGDRFFLGEVPWE
jgi:auxin-responsive protein IAA